MYEYRCDERLKTKVDHRYHIQLSILPFEHRDEVNRREVCECDG
jgi:hypothetical protein